VENGLIILVGATTQNPSFEIIHPLLSRTRVMTLRPLEKEDLKTILLRAIEDKEKGLGEMEIKILPQALEYLAELSSGDARVALNNLEVAVYYSKDDKNGPIVLELKCIENALNRKALPYDKEHLTERRFPMIKMVKNIIT
jgi:putative ATPase